MALIILRQDDESSWLSPSNDNDRSAIEALLRPYEDNGLEWVNKSEVYDAERSCPHDYYDCTPLG